MDTALYKCLLLCVCVCMYVCMYVFKYMDIFIFSLKSIRKIALVSQLFLVATHQPTKKISAFVDHQLKCLVPQITSYVKDANHFLAKLKDMERFPD